MVILLALLSQRQPGCSPFTSVEKQLPRAQEKSVTSFVLVVYDGDRFCARRQTELHREGEVDWEPV